MVKVETRNSVKGYFCSEFPAICYHCGVMAAWSRKTLKIFEIYVAFFWKTTPYGKIFKIMLWKFSSLHRSTCCVQISWNLAEGYLWNRALLTWQKKTKFRLNLKLSLLHGWLLKSARASSRQCTQSAPDRRPMVPLNNEMLFLWTLRALTSIVFM